MRTAGLTSLFVALVGALSLPANGAPLPWENPVISDNVTWSGEILLRNTVTVAAGATLRVLPGTRVTAEAGKGVGIVVLGGLRVEGTGSAPVVFQPGTHSEGHSAWEGIQLQGGKEAHVLSGFRIRGARDGIALTEASARLSDGVFAGCSTGLKGNQTSSAGVDNCLFDGNEAGALLSTGSKASFSRCRFEAIAGVGVVVEKGAAARVEGCSFSRGKTGLFAMTNAPCRIRDTVFSGLERGVVARQVGSESAVSRCRFENNGAGVLAVQFCSIEVSDSTFRENQAGVDVQEFSSPRVEHNRFEGNQVAVNLFRKSHPQVRRNIFIHNRNGVVANYSSYPRIEGNRFERNDMSVRLEKFQSGDWEERAGSAGITATQAADRGSQHVERTGQSATYPKRVDARGNYWGPDSGRDPAKGTMGKIWDGRKTGPVRYDGFGDAEYAIDVVDFSGELKTPPPDAGPREGAGAPPPGGER